jgi:hypothetical protein
MTHIIVARDKHDLREKRDEPDGGDFGVQVALFHQSRLRQASAMAAEVFQYQYNEDGV